MLALQFAVSAALAIMIPELVAAALFTAPTAPGDHLDFGPAVFTAGATLLLGGGLLVAVAISGIRAIARMRR